MEMRPPTEPQYRDRWRHIDLGPATCLTIIPHRAWKVTGEFQNENHFAQTWVLRKDGQEMPHKFDFTRVK